MEHMSETSTQDGGAVHVSGGAASHSASLPTRMHRVVASWALPCAMIAAAAVFGAYWSLNGGPFLSGLAQRNLWRALNRADMSSVMAMVGCCVAGYMLGYARHSLCRRRHAMGSSSPAGHGWVQFALAARLHAALELLRDLLPGHVVDELLEDTQQQQQHHALDCLGQVSRSSVVDSPPVLQRAHSGQLDQDFCSSEVCYHGPHPLDSTAAPRSDRRVSMLSGVGSRTRLSSQTEPGDLEDPLCSTGAFFSTSQALLSSGVSIGATSTSTAAEACTHAQPTLIGQPYYAQEDDEQSKGPLASWLYDNLPDRDVPGVPQHAIDDLGHAGFHYPRAMEADPYEPLARTDLRGCSTGQLLPGSPCGTGIGSGRSRDSGFGTATTTTSADSAAGSGAGSSNGFMSGCGPGSGLVPRSAYGSSVRLWRHDSLLSSSGSCTEAGMLAETDMSLRDLAVTEGRDPQQQLLQLQALGQELGGRGDPHPLQRGGSTLVTADAFQGTEGQHAGCRAACAKQLVHDSYDCGCGEADGKCGGNDETAIGHAALTPAAGGFTALDQYANTHAQASDGDAAIIRITDAEADEGSSCFALSSSLSAHGPALLPPPVRSRSPDPVTLAAGSAAAHTATPITATNVQQLAASFETTATTPDTEAVEHWAWGCHSHLFAVYPTNPAPEDQQQQQRPRASPLDLPSRSLAVSIHNHHIALDPDGLEVSLGADLPAASTPVSTPVATARLQGLMPSPRASLAGRRGDAGRCSYSGSGSGPGSRCASGCAMPTLTGMDVLPAATLPYDVVSYHGGGGDAAGTAFATTGAGCDVLRAGAKGGAGWALPSPRLLMPSGICAAAVATVATDAQGAAHAANEEGAADGGTTAAAADAAAAASTSPSQDADASYPVLASTLAPPHASAAPARPAERSSAPADDGATRLRGLLSEQLTIAAVATPASGADSCCSCAAAPLWYTEASAPVGLDSVADASSPTAQQGPLGLSQPPLPFGFANLPKVRTSISSDRPSVPCTAATAAAPPASPPHVCGAGSSALPPMPRRLHRRSTTSHALSAETGTAASSSTYTSVSAPGAALEPTLSVAAPVQPEGSSPSSSWQPLGASARQALPPAGRPGAARTLGRSRSVSWASAGFSAVLRAAGTAAASIALLGSGGGNGSGGNGGGVPAAAGAASDATRYRHQPSAQDLPSPSPPPLRRLARTLSTLFDSSGTSGTVAAAAPPLGPVARHSTPGELGRGGGGWLDGSGGNAAVAGHVSDDGEGSSCAWTFFSVAAPENVDSPARSPVRSSPGQQQQHAHPPSCHQQHVASHQSFSSQHLASLLRAAFSRQDLGVGSDTPGGGDDDTDGDGAMPPPPPAATSVFASAAAAASRLWNGGGGGSETAGPSPALAASPVDASWGGEWGGHWASGSANGRAGIGGLGLGSPGAGRPGAGVEGLSPRRSHQWQQQHNYPGLLAGQAADWAGVRGGAGPTSTPRTRRFQRVNSSAHLSSGYSYGSVGSPVHGHGTTPVQLYDAMGPSTPGVSGSGAGSARHHVGGSPTQLTNTNTSNSGSSSEAFGGGGGSSGHGPLYGGASGVGLGVRDLPYAEWHPCVSVLFADICGFTQISNKVSAVSVMEMLNALYCRLDALCTGGEFAGRVYKVQIIGDAYMVATGLLGEDPQHAATACRFALAILREASQVVDPCDGRPLQLRVGIHSGPAVSGVVGRMRRQYSVFGDTVNVASRMESTGAPGAIHVSEDTQALAAPYMSASYGSGSNAVQPGAGGRMTWHRREAVPIKGRGTLNTYWLLPAGGTSPPEQ